jgi:hypothetical protein
MSDPKRHRLSLLDETISERRQVWESRLGAERIKELDGGELLQV